MSLTPNPLKTVKGEAASRCAEKCATEPRERRSGTGYPKSGSLLRRALSSLGLNGTAEAVPFHEAPEGEAEAVPFHEAPEGEAPEGENQSAGAKPLTSRIHGGAGFGEGLHPAEDAGPAFTVALGLGDVAGESFMANLD